MSRVRRATSGWVLAGLLLGPWATALRAKEVDGIARLFFTRTEAFDASADSWGSTIDVRWNRQIGQPLDYQLSVRYSSQSQEPLNLAQPFDLRGSQLEPRLLVRWMPRLFDLDFGARWLILRNRIGDAAISTRTDDQYFLHFVTKWVDRPEIQVDLDRREYSAVGGFDNTESRAFGGLSYSAGWWDVAGGARWTELDSGSGLVRTTTEGLFNGNVNRRFRDGRVALFAHYDLSDVELIDRTPGQNLVTTVRPATQGLSVLDPLPADGALQDTPALIDGNRSGATPINIGGTLAGGSVGWNMGVQLALADPVDTLDIWLDSSIPTANALNIQWEIWVSDDNQIWTLQTAAPVVQFDELDASYRLGFGAVSTRYIKAVNVTVDDTLGPLFVTELEALGQELRDGRVETDNRTDNATVRVAWNPRPEYGVSLTGFNNRVRSETGTLSSRTESTTGNLAFNFRPSSMLLGTVSTLGTRRERSGADTESDWTYGFSLTAIPLEDLDLTIAASRRNRRRGSENADVLSYVFRVGSLLYRDLSVSASYGQQQEENFGTPLRNRKTVTAGINTRPRRELEFNSILLDERIEIPSAPPESRYQDNVNWNNRLTIRPSSQLVLRLQGIYFDNPTGSGWSKYVQVDWLPIAGGALQLSLDYRANDPFNNGERRVRRIRLRWNMNRDMFLDLDATRTSSELPTGVTAAQTMLTAFFQARF